MAKPSKPNPVPKSDDEVRREAAAGMRRMHVQHYPQIQSAAAERAYHDRLAAKGERDES